MAFRLLLRSQQRQLSLLSSNPSLLMFSDRWLTCMRSRRHQHHSRLGLLVKYDGEWSIQDLSSMTGIRMEDVISTLQALDLIKYWKGQHIVYVAPQVLAQQLTEHRVPRLCDESKLKWAPPAKAASTIAGSQQPPAAGSESLALGVDI